MRAFTKACLLSLSLAMASLAACSDDAKDDSANGGNQTPDCNDKNQGEECKDPNGGGAQTIDEIREAVATGDMPNLLSALKLFEWNPQNASFDYDTDVIPYDLNTALFSDYALKARAIWIPKGTTIQYQAEGPLDFPQGTIILKTFYFPKDLRKPTENINVVETRILVLKNTGWAAYPYIWNEAQTDAELKVGGAAKPQTFTNFKGDSIEASYVVPTRNQCKDCHDRTMTPGEAGPTSFLPIGPKARHLNRNYDYGQGEVNQLTHLAELGMLEGLPSLAEVGKAFDFHVVEDEYHRKGNLSAMSDSDVQIAARDYLEINCAHCHSPTGPDGITSQLFLNYDNIDSHRNGVCKRPGSAGNGTGGWTFDIVPGAAEQSILHYRMDTTLAGRMMPLLARSVRHDEGVELITEWINRMEPNAACLPEEGSSIEVLP